MRLTAHSGYKPVKLLYGETPMPLCLAEIKNEGRRIMTFSCFKSGKDVSQDQVTAIFMFIC